ncbi:MAG: ABC transporter ATP-binding protein [Deltaproteobacteria bacterium]|nr:ABC transporter ATP-binding protein [Deltaproteobacteria bacterium]
MMKALAINNLCKTYKNGVVALKGVNLEVEQGDFFGLIGANGAGKTTIIGIITDLVRKNMGEVLVFGKSIDKEFSRIKNSIGIVPQEFNFGVFEKVRDILINQAGYYGIPRRKAEAASDKYLKSLNLWEKRDMQARTLSGGMKRRLMIARSLVHAPQLLILDEPTAGVDVELRRGMWDFLLKLNQEGRTIILTTHYLEEAEYLCNNIGIINKGTIIENTSKKELVNQLDSQKYIFDLLRPIDSIPESTFKINKIDETSIEVEVSKRDTINDIFAYFNKNTIEIKSMKNKTNRLEETFLSLIEKDN